MTKLCFSGWVFLILVCNSPRIQHHSTNFFKFLKFPKMLKKKKPSKSTLDQLNLLNLLWCFARFACTYSHSGNTLCNFQVVWLGRSATFTNQHHGQTRLVLQLISFHLLLLLVPWTTVSIVVAKWVGLRVHVGVVRHGVSEVTPNKKTDFAVLSVCVYLVFHCEWCGVLWFWRTWVRVCVSWSVGEKSLCKCKVAQWGCVCVYVGWILLAVQVWSVRVVK